MQNRTPETKSVNSLGPTVDLIMTTFTLVFLTANFSWLIWAQAPELCCRCTHTWPCPLPSWLADWFSWINLKPCVVCPVPSHVAPDWLAPMDTGFIWLTLPWLEWLIDPKSNPSMSPDLLGLPSCFPLGSQIILPLEAALLLLTLGVFAPKSWALTQELRIYVGHLQKAVCSVRNYLMQTTGNY